MYFILMYFKETKVMLKWWNLWLPWARKHQISSRTWCFEGSNEACHRNKRHWKRDSSRNPSRKFDSTFARLNKNLRGWDTFVVYSTLTMTATYPKKPLQTSNKSWTTTMTVSNTYFLQFVVNDLTVEKKQKSAAVLS